MSRKCDKPFRNQISLRITVGPGLIHVFSDKLFLALYFFLLLQFHTTIVWLFSPYPSMKDLSMVINTPELARNKKIQNTKVFLEMTPYPIPKSPPASPLAFLFILVFFCIYVAYISYFWFHDAQRTYVKDECSLKCVISFSRRFFWMSFYMLTFRCLSIFPRKRFRVFIHFFASLLN